MAIGLTRICAIDQKEKIFYQWIDAIGGQHDSIGIDPSPIMPSYAYQCSPDVIAEVVL
jgi:hypothetical protein